MPYMMRVVVAGRVRETKKMHTSRVHTKGIERSPNSERTSRAQSTVNERAAEERLRWKLNDNFEYKDLHAVLHYADKERTLEQAEHDLVLFKRRLKRLCAAKGIPLKYISCTETKRLTNIHHHLVVNRMDPELLMEAWEGVPGGGGISFRPLDRRGNHAKLANYLIKETRSTVDRLKEQKRSGKRFSSSHNLTMPEPTYQKIPVASWRKEPKPHKGYDLMRFDDGSVARTGWHDITGYPWQEYFEILRE